MRLKLAKLCMDRLYPLNLPIQQKSRRGWPFADCSTAQGIVRNAGVPHPVDSKIASSAASAATLASSAAYTGRGETNGAIKERFRGHKRFKCRHDGEDSFTRG